MSNLGEIREIKKYVDYFYENAKSDFDADALILNLILILLLSNQH